MATRIPLRALIIEDCDDDVLLLVNAIKRGGFDPDFVSIDSKEDLSAALSQNWDIVFSDYTMPAFNGHEALALVRQHDPDVPFFFVSGTMGEDRAVEAMRLGAQDYFLKGNFERLSPAITRELRDSVSRRNHRRAEERIHYLANYDTLTGLPNRALLVERLLAHIEAAEPSRRNVTVFNLNLDRFRDINNHLGVAAADSLLIEFGRRLEAVTGPQDTVARLSADEFAIVITDLANEQARAAMAKKLFTALAQPFSLSRYEWSIHGSMGSSAFPHDGIRATELLNCAAMALRHARKIAGNSYLPYAEEMRVALEEKLSLGRALEHALKQQEFQVHYQPQVATKNGAIMGIEALLRWDRPGVGPVGPNTFIPIAEESGLIMPIGDWVLREVCGQIRRWRDEGLPLTRVAVNFSAYQFRQRNRMEVIRGVLEEFELPGQCLEIEITETALMQDANAARSILSALRKLGVSVALDDFGTGYSSLSYLKRFPVDVLKIDREFICDLPHDKDDVAIVHAIIAMADKLGLQVVAEGVETVQQLDFLMGAGCGMVQGYYLQRPASADALVPVLQKGAVAL
jgi:diguanylate cyclase (GGDEF)-like protein